MLTIPNPSSIPKAFQAFDETGQMRPAPLYDRIIDVMEEWMKFTLPTRDQADYPADRHSKRKANAGALTKRVNLTAATRSQPFRQTLIEDTSRMATRTGSSTASGTMPSRWPPMATPITDPKAMNSTKPRLRAKTEKLSSKL